MAGKGRLCARPRRLHRSHPPRTRQCGQIYRARRRAEQQRSVRSRHGRLREGDGPRSQECGRLYAAGPTSGRTRATAPAPSPTTAKPFAATPTSADRYAGRAFVYRNGGDWDRAIADFSEAIRLDPKEPGRYASRGDVWDEKSDYDRAMADFDKAISLNPRYAAAYNGRSNVWRNRRQLDRALTEIKEAVRLEPKNSGFADVACQHLSSRWMISTSRIATYGEALALDPTIAIAYGGRGIVYSEDRRLRPRDGRL